MSDERTGRQRRRLTDASTLAIKVLIWLVHEGDRKLDWVGLGCFGALGCRFCGFGWQILWLALGRQRESYSREDKDKRGLG